MPRHASDQVAAGAGARNAGAAGRWLRRLGGRFLAPAAGPLAAIVLALAPALALADEISITADNAFNLYVNGSLVGSGNSWPTVYQFNVSLSGNDVIAIEGVGSGGPAGVIATVILSNGKVIVTNSGWRSTDTPSPGWQNPGYNDSGWGESVAQTNSWGVTTGSGAEWIWPPSMALNAYFRRDVAFRLQDDNFSTSPFSAITGGTTATSVLANDLLNGAAAAAASVNLTITSNGGLTGAAFNAAGQVMVPAGQAPGSYSLVYSACEAAWPDLCASATATIEISNPVDAVNDDLTLATPANGVQGTPTSFYLFNNDTIGGAAFGSIVDDGGLTGVSIISGGRVVVPAMTAAGTYSITYRVCAVAAPAACDTATATFRVATLIDAVDDDFSSAPVNGFIGGLVNARVSHNDSIGNSLVLYSPQLVTFSIVNNGGTAGATIDATGYITMAPGVPGGNYGITYQICFVAWPAVCDTALTTIAVEPTVIDAVNDDYTLLTPSDGFAGGRVGKVINNDRAGTSNVYPEIVTGSIIDDGGVAGVANDASGFLVILPRTTVGTFTVTYRLCSSTLTTICDTATARFSVSVTEFAYPAYCSSTYNKVVNGGFESPSLGTAWSSIIANGAVSGWSSTDTGIEIWKNGNLGIASANGSQFMELNANNAGSTVTMAPVAVTGRTLLEVRFFHRARNGSETVRMTISDNGGGAPLTVENTAVDYGWGFKATSFVTSAEASTATLAFQSVSPSGAADYGNFIDMVSICPTWLTLGISVLSKTDTDGSGTDTPGDVLRYRYTISNPSTSFRTLGQIGISVPGIVGSFAPTIVSGDMNANSSIEPGETWTATISSTLDNTILTQAQLDAGSVVKSAYVLGRVPFTSIFAYSGDTQQAVPLTAVPALSVTKTASAPGFTTGDVSNAPAGTVLTYTYVVRNTGNQTIRDIALSDLHNGNGTDPAPGSEAVSLDLSPAGDTTDVTAGDGVWSVLARRDAITFTATYTVTQQDVDLLQ